MLTTLKTVINNLNQFPYLKNRDRVEMQMIDDSNRECINQVYVEGSREKIDELETKNRVHNLSVFLPNYLKIFKYKFFFVSLPVMLITASIASFKLPSVVQCTGKITKYKKTTTVYNPDEGIFEREKDVCNLGFDYSLAGAKVISPEGIQILDSFSDPSDWINLVIQDGKKFF